MHGRYHRQELLPGIGQAGQARLAASHALIVGMGALGCQVADLLVRAGVATLTIIDRDVVELTNLQRQTLYCEADAAEGRPKALAAAARLAAVNSCVLVRPLVADFSARNAEAILAEANAVCPVGIIIDGADNFDTRYLMNDLAVKHGVPYIYGGVIACRGMMMALRINENAPCLRCIFPDPPAPGSQMTCDTAGVLGSAVAIVGAHEAADAIKVLSGAGDTVPRTLLDFDLWMNQQRTITIGKAAHCICCVRREFHFLSRANSGDTTSLCGSNAVQVWPRSTGGGEGGREGLDLPAIASRLAAVGSVTATAFMVRCQIEGGARPLQLTIFADGRAVVHGTTNADIAKGAYAKYIGM